MLNRIFFFPAILLALFLSGCGSKPELVLYKPGDIEVWKPSKTGSKGIAVDRPKVEVKTNKGSFVIELFEKEAPISVENFLQYVDEGFYDNTLFHRIISGFMIQGGGFEEGLVSKEARPSIVNEAGNGLRNLRGTVALARTSDLNSATSQFFVNIVNNGFLDGDGITSGYAVFGRVYEGMAVVDEIAQVETGVQNGMSDVPVEAVIIESISRL